MKRVIDFVISLILILLLSPIIVGIAAIIKANMGSPVLFRQQRPGLYGKAFYLYKFRTMNHLSDDKGELQSDWMRLTPLGTFIRKYSLDELPQLVNVIKGDMSLVGPRPLLMEYLSLYTKSQRIRHNVKPGITGWSQINGRNTITWEEKFALDIWYVENRSLSLDLKILISTIGKVIKKEGITHQDHASMEKFTGSNDVI